MGRRIGHWAAHTALLVASVMAVQTHAQEPVPDSTPDQPAAAQDDGLATPNQQDLLEGELTRVEQQIAAAQEEVDSYDGGLLLTLAQMRLETLKLSRALLEQRLFALREGATFEFQVPAVQPDPQQAEAVLADIQQTKDEILTAEQEVDRYSGGLVRSLALTTLMTHRQTLAALEQKYYQFSYGIVGAQSLQGRRDGAPGKTAASDGEPQDGPEDQSLLQAMAEATGMEVIGHWAISREPSPIDDSPNVIAVNISQDASTTSVRSTDPTLMMRCIENSTTVGMSPDTYMLGRNDRIDVTYRIDDAPAVEARWSLATNSQFAGLWGAGAAAPFIRELLGAETLFVQFTERDGDRHRATFALDGIEVVAAEVASTCGWELQTSPAASQDRDNWIEELQQLLKEEGFYAGAIDGLLGPQTRSAIGRYQANHELPITGQADEQTLEAMGIDRE